MALGPWEYGVELLVIFGFRRTSLFRLCTAHLVYF